MSEYRLMMCIVRREQSEEYIAFFKSRGVETQFLSLCRGTASRRILDYLGIEKTEKVLLQTMVPASEAGRLLRRLVDRMGIEVSGNGVAMTIPIRSVGGQSSLQYLTRGQNLTTDGVKTVSDIRHSLIVAIADKGNTDSVMDAARIAGARGGTILNARGTAADASARFFGMSIGEEKEIVYILARKEEREAIMHAIMERAGKDTDSHTVLFSLPVDGTAGLAAFETEE